MLRRVRIFIKNDMLLLERSLIKIRIKSRMGIGKMLKSTIF